MPSVIWIDPVEFETSCDVLVIGAGAAGLIAALRAQEAGAEVVVLERDRIPTGSTALSAGLIPAAQTRFQRAVDIRDSHSGFAADIIAKAQGEADATAVAHVVAAVGPAIEWLAERHGLAFSVIDDFTYPGHAACRMHALPSRSGSELMDRLRNAAEACDIPIITQAPVETLLVDRDGRILGVEILRPDGGRERMGCKALVLACNGYGANRALVEREIPSLSGALYFGHPGNQGDAVLWGEALGAQTRHLSGHQGHGSVAHPHGILITWATITEGGFQVNLNGQRFANEARGYSEAAQSVIAQPEALAFTIFDARIAAIARQFEDFRNAEAGGAILIADDLAALAARTGLSPDALEKSMRDVAAWKDQGLTDPFGRRWKGVPQLVAPFCAVKVTGALFHTQGGLVVDGQARVCRPDGRRFANLFAAGGAACGVSGAQASGYLSGNGLLTAFAYGYIGGAAAAEIARQAGSAAPVSQS